MLSLNLHRRCESIEASLRAQVSDLRDQVSDLQAEINHLRDVGFQRERELIDRLLAATDPSVAARVASAARSDRPAAGLPGVPVGRQRIPSASPFVRLESLKPRQPLAAPTERPGSKPDSEAAAAVAAVAALATSAK